jgi:hypothetical protein
MAGRSWAFPWASHIAVTNDARQGENRHLTLAWGCCGSTSFLTTSHSANATSCRTLPVNTASYRISRLAIPKALHELEERHEHQARGANGQLSNLWEERGEVGIGKEHAQFVTDAHDRTALGEGCAGHTLGFGRDQVARLRMHRHESLPSLKELRGHDWRSACIVAQCQPDPEGNRSSGVAGRRFADSIL